MSKVADVAVGKSGVFVAYIHPEDAERLVGKLKQLGLRFKVKVVSCG